jgi:uncharacterized cupredoxin-like copper-binding protein
MKSTGRANRTARAGSLLLAAVVLIPLLAASCSRGEAAPRGKVVAVEESDFKLTTTVLLVHAGLVTFQVHNAGPSTHEFNVDRTDLAADSLPLRADALSVNEDSKRLHVVGGMDGIRMDATRELTLRLSPGHYVMFCNLEGHYLGGMHALIQVAG